MSDSVSGRKSPVTNAAEMTALTRSVAAAWVEREERKTGSRMAAYEEVAQQVGTSSSWLRKFVNDNDEAKQPNWIVGWNLLTAYRRICERVEQAAENERTRARALEGQVNAAISSAVGLVARVPDTETHRDEGEST